MHIRSLIAGALAAVLALGLLSGCGGEDPPAPQTEQTVPTTAPATVPPDGDPEDVTCKGSYTGLADPQTVVATVGEEKLSLARLQFYYWAEVAAYRREDRDIAPDFDAPLDTQACPLDDGVATWQQYFLRRALTTWHSAQALILEGFDEGVPLEEAYAPNLENHEKYLVDIPATRLLYGYTPYYQPNSLHQAYLDSLGDTLEALARERGYADAEAMAQGAFGTALEDLKAAVELYNRGYMYFTTLSYSLETTPEEAASRREGDAPSARTVDIRHILLLPEEEGMGVADDGAVTCSEAAWEACQAAAEKLLADWRSQRGFGEASFADLAYRNSRDTGTAADGGAYHGLTQGQLEAPLDAWCFDPGRAAGDTVVLRSADGCHILYFSGSKDDAQAALTAEKQEELILDARRKYPMKVDYSAITLAPGEGSVSTDDVLYPDVAHQRFPEVPLYLQQDYGNTRYGRYQLSVSGCGVTSMAMVGSYLSDDEMTPPELCAKFGSYSYETGTDGALFTKESAGLGFYCIKKTHDPEEAHRALEEGHVLIAVQSKGYWTKGGHYIVVEKLNADGTVQVRDSHLLNYGRIEGHKADKHTWRSVTSTNQGFWIFAHKVVRVNACQRCGEGKTAAGCPLVRDYTCHKCAAALLRRGTYLAWCGGTA